MAALRLRRQAAVHTEVGEVGVGVAEGRQLPVEHTDNLLVVAAEDEIVEPVVAVHQRHSAVIGGQVLLQPVRERIHGCNLVGLGVGVLASPTLQLAGKVVAGSAVVAKAALVDIDGVNGSQYRGHLLVDAAALAVVCSALQCRIPVDIAVEVLHQIKLCPGDTEVAAQM